MNTRHRIIVAAASLLVASASFAQSHVEQTTPKQGALTRTEVLADLALWKRAGLSNSMDDYDISSTSYQQALARYQQLRNSPAYAAEVERIANKRGESLAALKQAPSAN